MTDKSFKVRLLNIKYVDTSGKMKPVTQSGFVIEEDDSIWEKKGSDDDYCFSRKVGACKITIQWVDFMGDDYEKCWTLGATDEEGYCLGGKGTHIDEKNYIAGFGREDVEKVKEASMKFASACLDEHVKAIKRDYEKLLVAQKVFEETQILFTK